MGETRHETSPATSEPSSEPAIVLGDMAVKLEEQSVDREPSVLAGAASYDVGGNTVFIPTVNTVIAIRLAGVHNGKVQLRKRRLNKDEGTVDG